MTEVRQGYLILALGPEKYIEMGANLAASIHVMDNTRPVCLIHDSDVGILKKYSRYFDNIIFLESDERYPHVMNKLRLYDISPYKSTMFVDADCLLVKNDIENYWDMASTRAFSITGSKSTSGKWKGIDIETILRQEDAPYLIRMNAGVFYFDKSEESRKFFDGLNDFYLRRREHLNISLYHGVKTQTDELYIGLYMGLTGMDCDNVANIDNNSWMVSTWRALYCDFKPEIGRSIIYKGDNHAFGMPFLPRKVTKLSPSFAHFIGLKPRRLYRQLAERFRALNQAL